jgi:hypothetical protein
MMAEEPLRAADLSAIGSPKLAKGQVCIASWASFGCVLPDSASGSMSFVVLACWAPFLCFL